MAKAAKKTMPIPDKTAQIIYRITAKRDGFRRAGIVHAGVAMLDAPLLGSVAGSGAFVSDRPPVFTPENLKSA